MSTDAPLLSADAPVDSILTDAGSVSEHFREAIEATSDYVFTIDIEGDLLYMNRAARALFGLSATEDVAGTNAMEFYSPWVRSMLVDDALRSVINDGSWQGEVSLRRPDGFEVPVSQVTFAHYDDGGIANAITSIARDLTNQKAVEAELRAQAFYDMLTGLPNRMRFGELIGEALKRAEVDHTPVAVAVCDLNAFKMVNESLGHEAGDRLLIAVADRLQGALGPTDQLGRVVGDVFAILCEGDVPTDLAALGPRVQSVLERSFRLQGREVYLSASVGLTSAHRRDTSAEKLLREAESAVERAKSFGRGRCCVFDGSLRIWTEERLEIERALREGIANDEISVVFQPEFDVATGRFVGAEALARWDHPERGQIHPLSFISLAEETGLIMPLGEIVLRNALRQLSEWAQLGSEVFVAINISARQLSQPGFLERLGDRIVDVDTGDGVLALEITESALADSSHDTVAALAGLRELGAQIVMDDFGTGYSSLAYLKTFPLDVLKIDRSFVTNLPDDAVDRAIVRATLEMAHALGLKVVAEGVESQTHLELLADMGCDIAQGFHLGRPEPAARLRHLVVTGRP